MLPNAICFVQHELFNVNSRDCVTLGNLQSLQKMQETEIIRKSGKAQTKECDAYQAKSGHLQRGESSNGSSLCGGLSDPATKYRKHKGGWIGCDKPRCDRWFHC